MDVLNIIPNNFKKQFVIFNRNESNDLGQLPKLNDSTNRTCFLYDKITRTLFQHSIVNKSDTQLLGNTYFGTIGKHNETHNDYTNNKIEGTGSFGSVFGSNNILKYNNDGGFVAGRYNNPDATYIFTIGNGTDANNRRNLVQVTDCTFSINCGLEINGQDLNTIISNAADNEIVQDLKNRVAELETQLNVLITELKSHTILVEDNPTISDEVMKVTTKPNISTNSTTVPPTTVTPTPTMTPTVTATPTVTSTPTSKTK